MSSGFISERTGEASTSQNDDWTRAQQIIDATRTRKQESKQDGGKSLYEVLEQNKAAKQEAFEESIRLKNQFRNLDEDEVDFLDSVLESTRAQEKVVKKETAERLEAFRKQREAAEKVVVDESTLNDGNLSPQNDESWTAHPSRKRRRAKDNEAQSTGKLRKLSSSNHESVSASKPKDVQSGRPSIPRQIEKVQSQGSTSIVTAKTTPSKPPSPASTVLPSLGLGVYSSDEE